METVSESFLVFGRASLGATIGLAIGWPTQHERHSRYVVALVLAGYFIGCLAMLPDAGAAAAAIILVVPASLIAFVGMIGGALTLGDREDWWIRSWGFAAFIAGYQALTLVAGGIVDRMDG
ncbi:MAG: hypothetical protein R3B97_10660 [Dehalococcoidia bacterium]|nr:hypothetical protein [Dehalococcoidia bacterium]MCB9484985.1 hypothetical protein [Thermoflexaceae bacterium]